MVNEFFKVERLLRTFHAPKKLTAHIFHFRAFLMAFPLPRCIGKPSAQ